MDPELLAKIERNRQEALLKLKRKNEEKSVKEQSEIKNTDEGNFANLSDVERKLSEGSSKDAPGWNELLKCKKFDDCIKKEKEPISIQLISKNEILISPFPAELKIPFPFTRKQDSIRTETHSVYSFLMAVSIAKEKGFKVDDIPKIVLQIANAAKYQEESKTFDLTCIDKKLLDSLFPFQKEGIQFTPLLIFRFAIRNAGRILLADDMGLGKTIQAIGIACYYSIEWPLLVICPASLTISWMEAFIEWLPYSVKSENIQLIRSKESFYGGEEKRIFIVSYDMAVRLAHSFSSCKPFHVIIADESHCLKSPDSKRSKIITPMLQNSSRAILLSGTPALSNPIELFQQIKSLSPKMFPSLLSFGKRYCGGIKGYFGWEYKKATNTKELSFLLTNKLMIRRMKDDVLNELPPKRRKQVFLPIADLSCYSKAEKSISDEKTGYLGLYKLTGQLKFNAVWEYVMDLLEKGLKVLLFMHHIELMDFFYKKLMKDKPCNIIRIDGSVPSMERQELCSKFQSDDSIRLALLGITAASVGLTLTSANVVVFAELFWNPGILVQAEDRAHRIGQKDSVSIHYLLAKGTLDDKMWPLIMNKISTLEQVGIMKNEYDNFESKKTLLDYFIQ